jgi:hypothetical protein
MLKSCLSLSTSKGNISYNTDKMQNIVNRIIQYCQIPNEINHMLLGTIYMYTTHPYNGL